LKVAWRRKSPLANFSGGCDDPSGQWFEGRKPDGSLVTSFTGSQGDGGGVALIGVCPYCSSGPEKEVTSDPSGLRPSNHWPLGSSHPPEKFARGDFRRQATFSSYQPPDAA